MRSEGIELNRAFHGMKHDRQNHEEKANYDQKEGSMEYVVAAEQLGFVVDDTKCNERGELGLGSVSCQLKSQTQS